VWGENPTFIQIFVQFFVCFQNFMLPGLCASFVQTAQDSAKVLSWMLILGMIVGSLARLLAANSGNSLHQANDNLIILLIGVQTLVFCLEMFVFPSFGTSPSGYTEATLYVILNGSFGYLSTVLYLIAAKRSKNVVQRELSSTILGSVEQAGAFTGSIASFLVVSYILY